MARCVANHGGLGQVEWGRGSLCIFVRALIFTLNAMGSN